MKIDSQAMGSNLLLFFGEEAGRARSIREEEERNDGDNDSYCAFHEEDPRLIQVSVICSPWLATGYLALTHPLYPP